MYLFFDTETSGLPRRWDAAPGDLQNWPRLVQIGWIVADEGGNEIAAREHLIRPNGFTIAPDAVARHGITTEHALAAGVELLPVLDEFAGAVHAARVIAGHNVDFDRNVAGAELLRAGMRDVLSRKRRVCTMKETAEYCRLPGRYGRFKWPTLTELHQKLFGEPFDGAHGALADAAATMRCFLRLKELGVLG